MLWKFLDAGLEPFKAGFPELAGTAVVMAPVADFRHELLGVEQQESAAMAEVRQFGFSTGRHCAHLVQQMLGLDVQAVGRNDRAPQWPETSMGSITHSAHIAAAIATTRFASVGIDVEETGRVNKKLYRTLFTPAEQARLPAFEFDAATVMFSAKEAGYKAVHPLARTYVGFQEAEVHLDAARRSFSIEYTGSHQPNKVLDTGRGYWVEHEGHVMTVFTIP